MATEAQIQANCLNAQRSTGPRTAEGKAEVSQNAVKHGLFAREGVIRGESREEYEMHREMLLEQLGPVGPLEVILASRVVDLTWRLQRAAQDRNETFGALYDRYVAREGPAGPEAGSDGGTALGVEGVVASKRGQDARDTQGQDALATRGRDARDTQGQDALATRGQDARGTQGQEALDIRGQDARDTQGQDARDTDTAAERGATLGRMILEDFGRDAVLERLLRYERRIEGSLYRTLRELRCVHDQGRPADREVADTLARWREEDTEARRTRAFAFDPPADGSRRPAGGTTNTPRTEVPPASEIPSSPFTDPVPDSPRESETRETNPNQTRPEGPGTEDETCETNPMAERVSSRKRQVASESCETNPSAERVSSWKCQVPSESCKTNPIASVGTPPAGPGTPERAHVHHDSAIPSFQHSHHAPAPLHELCKTNPISGKRGKGTEAQRELHSPGVQNKANLRECQV